MSGNHPFKTFKEFYPFYLSEHTNQVSRRLHVIGTSVALVIILSSLVSHLWWLLVVAVLIGYLFAWSGHFFFEHNKPATFRYPLFSLMGDWRMWWEVMSGKRKF